MTSKQLWIVVLAVVGLTAAWTGADEPAAKATSDVRDLDGQLVAITLMSDTGDLVLLKDVHEKSLGGKSFLVGVGVDDGETPDWRNLAGVWIPLDDVQQLITFKTVEDYKKNIHNRASSEGKAAAWRKKRA